MYIIRMICLKIFRNIDFSLFTLAKTITSYNQIVWSSVLGMRTNQSAASPY